MLVKPKYKFEMDVEDPEAGMYHNLYRQVENRREKRALDTRIGSVDEQLKDIAAEVQTRVKITQQEIFFIGELLVQAKEILKADNNRSFPDWVNATFDFGYHTAINFCHVYTACVGRLEYIKYVKPSVLYQISAKSFPKELRDILLINDLLKDMKNAEVKEIYIEFQEKGFKAVKPKLEERANKALILAHVAPFEDNLKKVTYEIEKSIHRLTEKPKLKSGIVGIKGATEIGNEIASIIIGSFNECLKILSEAHLEASKKFKEKIYNPTPFITLIPHDDKNPPQECSGEIVNELQISDCNTGDKADE